LVIGAQPGKMYEQHEYCSISGKLEKTGSQGACEDQKAFLQSKLSKARLHFRQSNTAALLPTIGLDAR
jgi:hypothetical protein